jgi:hypothetical protein
MHMMVPTAACAPGLFSPRKLIALYHIFSSVDLLLDPRDDGLERERAEFFATVGVVATRLGTGAEPRSGESPCCKLHNLSTVFPSRPFDLMLQLPQLPQLGISAGSCSCLRWWATGGTQP